MEHIEHGKIGWIVSVKTKAEFTVNVFDFQSIHIFQCEKGVHKTDVGIYIRYGKCMGADIKDTGHFFYEIMLGYSCF